MKIMIIFVVMLISVGGCVLLVLSFLNIRTLVQLKNQGVETTGIVDSVYTHYLPDGGPVTVYEIVFTSINGESVEITNQFFVNDKRYEVGDRIPLLYMKNDPNNAIISTTKETIVPLFFYLATTFFLLTIAGLIIGNFRKIEKFITKNRSLIDFN